MAAAARTLRGLTALVLVGGSLGILGSAPAGATPVTLTPTCPIEDLASGNYIIEYEVPFTFEALAPASAGVGVPFAASFPARPETLVAEEDGYTVTEYRAFERVFRVTGGTIVPGSLQTVSGATIDNAPIASQATVNGDLITLEIPGPVDPGELRTPGLTFSVTPLANGTPVRITAVTGDFEVAISLGLEYGVECEFADAVLAQTTVGSEPTPGLSIDSVRQVEGSKGSSRMVFTVSLTQPLAHDVKVSYATSDGSAAARLDYGAKKGKIRIKKGTTSAQIKVRLRADKLPEAAETFLVSLTNPVGATLAQPIGQGTILNDD